MRGRELARGAWIAIGMSASLAVPAHASQGLASIKQDLKTIEDHLRAEEWRPAKTGCDRLLKQLIADFARGHGARPLFGLTFAFRAVAEAGLDDTTDALWDWSAAEQFSSDSTRFDPARFGDAGRRLAAASAAMQPERSKFEADLDRALRHEPVSGGSSEALPETPSERPTPPKRLVAPPPPFPHLADRVGFEGIVAVAFVIGATGRPEAVLRIVEGDLDGATGMIANTLEGLREWRFRPATAHGQPVRSPYFQEVRYQPSREILEGWTVIEIP